MGNIEKAKQTADYAHALQKRKGSNKPYSVHPHGVADIVSRYTDNEDAIMAAELHDVLEDVPSNRYSEDEMRAEFGEEVVRLVKLVSEDKTADDKVQKPWIERKNAYFEHLTGSTNKNALIIATADKIDNLMSMINDYGVLGERLWENFNAPKDKQLWYYQTILDILSTKDLPSILIAELAEQVDALCKICETSI
jgi:(p)ppGpp synthase/HD superfamily hydrolase